MVQRRFLPQVVLHEKRGPENGSRQVEPADHALGDDLAGEVRHVRVRIALIERASAQAGAACKPSARAAD
ncbi:hypothetical protein [Stenotrophomonas nitritireducens]|uniref:hypothetical protein n=1 Tax=Stenotrophomonas nitritireducens TaxID=83617 RepID=UPI003D996C39